MPLGMQEKAVEMMMDRLPAEITDTVDVRGSMASNASLSENVEAIIRQHPQVAVAARKAVDEGKLGQDTALAEASGAWTDKKIQAEAEEFAEALIAADIAAGMSPEEIEQQHREMRKTASKGEQEWHDIVLAVLAGHEPRRRTLGAP